MSDWHVQIGQQQYGPVSESELRDWIAQGRVGPGDYVWTSTMPTWAAAGTVFQFGSQAPAAGVAQGPSSCPPVGVCPPYYKPNRAGLILAFGILGFCVCTIFGILAWIWGNQDLREMKAGTMDPTGESLTNTGRILGMIATILACAGIVLYVVFLIFFFSFGAVAAHH